MNRILTTGDCPSYAKPGDLLFDSYTKDRQILYYKMSEAFPSLKSGATLWIDGSALRNLTDFRLVNGANENPWHIRELTIKPVPGTQVTINSSTGYGLCVHGLNNLTIDGGDSYRGLSSYVSRFRTGTFGFKVHTKVNSGQSFSLSVQPEGSLTMRNFEASGGFAAVRIHGSVEGVVDLYISNFYVHDTVDGEGFYIGSTQSTPVTKFTGYIADGIIARTACEALQLQHCVDMDVERVSIFAADTAWINPFQPYQDTAIQWVCAGGHNRLSDIVVDGFGSVGLNLFGGDGLQAQNIAYNLVFNNGKGIGVNIHHSTKTSATWTLDKLAFNNMTNEFFSKTKITTTPSLISPNTGTDRFQVYNINSNTYDIDIAYVNSGFTSSNIQQWKHYWTPHLQAGALQAPTSWKKDEVVIDNGFYKCLVDHVTDGIVPKNSDKFMALKWDSNGVRNDNPEYSPGNDSLLPPDDLRILK